MARTADPENRERRRLALLEAAARCFARDGFEGTRTAEICREAGLSSGVLYYYFDSKRDVLLALVDTEVRELADVEVPRRPAAARRVLREVLREACRQADDPVANPLALEVAALARRDEEVMALVRAGDLALRELVGRLAVAGGSTVDAGLAGTWVAALVDGTFHRATIEPGFSATQQERVLWGVVTGFLGWGRR